MATVSTCFESALNSACCCSICPRTSLSLPVTFERVFYGRGALENSEILQFLSAQITETGFLIDILAVDVLRVEFLAVDAEPELTDGSAHFIKSGDWHADVQRCGGRFGPPAVWETRNPPTSSARLRIFSDISAGLVTTRLRVQVRMSLRLAESESCGVDASKYGIKLSRSRQGRRIFRHS